VVFEVLVMVFFVTIFDFRGLGHRYFAEGENFGG
jgi:hypothetical protein